MKDDFDELVEGLNSKDELGLVLRTSFLSEELLDRWISGKLKHENLFKNINFFFSQKIQLSKNIGLPGLYAKFFKALNSERNSFAHRKNHALSNSFYKTAYDTSILISKYQDDFKLHGIYIYISEQKKLFDKDVGFDDFDLLPMRRRYEYVFGGVYISCRQWINNEISSE